MSCLLTWLSYGSAHGQAHKLVWAPVVVACLQMAMLLGWLQLLLPFCACALVQLTWPAPQPGASTAWMQQVGSWLLCPGHWPVLVQKHLCLFIPSLVCDRSDAEAPMDAAHAADMCSLQELPCCYSCMVRPTGAGILHKLAQAGLAEAVLTFSGKAGRGLDLDLLNSSRLTPRQVAE
jgi:hypothetical protein